MIVFLIKLAGMPCRTKFIQQPNTIGHSKVAYSIIFVPIKRMQSDTDERESQNLISGRVHIELHPKS